MYHCYPESVSLQCAQVFATPDRFLIKDLDQVLIEVKVNER